MARISVEDCQEKLPNRFELVMVAANRARRLMENNEPLVKSNNKHCVTALREIAEGAIVKVGGEFVMETDTVDLERQ